MYNNIINPLTNKSFKINSFEGKQLLKKYIKIYLNGGVTFGKIEEIILPADISESRKGSTEEDKKLAIKDFRQQISSNEKCHYGEKDILCKNDKKYNFYYPCFTRSGFSNKDIKYINMLNNKEGDVNPTNFNEEYKKDKK